MENRNLIQVLNEFGAEYRNVVQDLIIQDGGIASGEMLNAMDFRTGETGGSIIVYLEHTDYFPYYNDGSPAHWPPREPIERWIENKPIYPDERNGSLPTVQQLAFLIARAMAGKSPHQSELKNPDGGTEAHNIMDRAFKEVFPKYEKKIYEAQIKDFVESELKGLVKFT